SLLAERHEAFGELVARFQDMAFGCAYAVLGDYYLAEDVAQEAFINAWQRLHQLRTPAAFPGWLRRIVLTECNRLTRGKRLQFVPLDEGVNTPLASPDAGAIAEQREIREKVLAALKSLPVSERVVTTLFYIDGYTQADIGEFLQLPVTTINKRLYTARQRLKGSVVEIFKGDLRRQRPSRDESFATKVKASLRPFKEEDWNSISQIAPARERFDPEGFDLWLRGRQQFNESRYVRRHYLAEHASTGQLVGYGAIEQSIYLPKYRLFLVIDPLWLRRGVGDLLLDRLTNDLQEVNAVTVSFREYAAHDEILNFLNERGFIETMRLMDLRLSVEEADLAPFSTVVEKVRERGISISTLAEERAHDPRYVEKLYELTSTLRIDDPLRDPFTPASFYEREARLWLERPYVLPAAYFIAKHNDNYVGVTDLNLLDVVPEGVTHGFTGVRRDYRRQGVCTALKVRAIEYAREQGYRTVRAFNSPLHQELLALNEKLGFRSLFSYVTLEKCLREIVTVSSNVYDKYAGRYRDDTRCRDLVIIIKNEAGRLTAEAIGQKVELFPESETKFFVKQFYGQITFFKDENGEVTHLISRTRGLNQPETVLHAKKIE
ncbi:MAG TPA: GNAT family N-acetyltransferase, partial [Pyrinomonadaceae bacterium]|nr:GNAT family N-acetyltransferase [Pyrinomonadaceae bacterium]